jgi:hypothetical protein
VCYKQTDDAVTWGLRQFGACYFGSEAGWELLAECGGWQLEFNSAQELADEGSTGWNQRSEYDVGVRWTLPYDDLNSEAEERPTFEAAAKQRDWQQCVW